MEVKEETIYEYILKLRLAKGVTQYRAAKEMNINRSALKRLEDGNYVPRRRTLEAISDYYNAPLNVLLEKTQAFRDWKKQKRKEELAKANENWI